MIKPPRASAPPSPETSTSAPGVSAVASRDDGFAAAYQRCLPEMKALAADALRPSNLDVGATAALVLGVVPTLAALRPALAACGGFDVTTLDRLEDYAHAVLHADAAWKLASARSSGWHGLRDELVRTRRTLAMEARLLAARGLLDPASVRRLLVGRGRHAAVADLVRIVGLLRSSWDAIASRTSLTMTELDQVSALADRVLRAAYEDKLSTAPVPTAADMRRRAFTLLSRAYDEVRAALAFVRRAEGDAETLAPSFYRTRRRRPSAAARHAAHAPSTSTHAAAATSPPGAVASEAPSEHPASPTDTPSQTFAKATLVEATGT